MSLLLITGLVEGGLRLDAWCPSLCNQEGLWGPERVVSRAEGATPSENQAGCLGLPRGSSMGAGHAWVQGGPQGLGRDAQGREETPLGLELSA